MDTAAIAQLVELLQGLSVLRIRMSKTSWSEHEIADIGYALSVFTGLKEVSLIDFDRKMTIVPLGRKMAGSRVMEIYDRSGKRLTT